MFIYVIVCSENLKLYVGQHKGTDLQKYLWQKFSHARRQEAHGSHLYNAMRKYPREAWGIHPLVSGVETKADLDDLERHFIRVLKTQHPDVGYNICRGGEGFTGPCSEETKRKLRVTSKAQWDSLTLDERQARGRRVGDAQRGVPKPSALGNQYAAGRKPTPAGLARRIAKNTGRKRTQEQKDRMASAMGGNKNGVGHVVTPEHREKISAAKRQWWAAKKCRVQQK